jgi:AraC-like DNA-binding protein
MSVIPLFPTNGRTPISFERGKLAEGHLPERFDVAVPGLQLSSLSSCIRDHDCNGSRRRLGEVERDMQSTRSAISTSIWSARRDGSTAFVEGHEIALGHPLANDMGCFGSVHPDDLPRTLARWSGALRTGQPFHDVHRVRRPSGEYEVVLVNGVAIRDENGGVACWLGAKTATGDPDVHFEEPRFGDPTPLGANHQLSVAQLDYDDRMTSAATYSAPAAELFQMGKSLPDAVSIAIDAALSTSSQCLDPKLFRDSRINALVQDLSNADRIPPELVRLYSHFLCVAILARIGGSRAIGRRHLARRRIAALPKWRFTRVAQYIGDHMEDSINLADLARAAGLTRMHFAAQFRATVGVSPHEYLLRRRIERAQTLLQDPKQRLVDVALSVGFQAQPHFTTVFRRFVGVSPHRWRLSQGVEGRIGAAAAVHLRQLENV